MTSLDLMGTYSSQTQLITVSSLHWRLQILPVHCLTLQYCYSLFSSSLGTQRVEADGSHRRHQYSPVYRRLANDKLKTAMLGIHSQGGTSCQKLGLDHKFLKNQIYFQLHSSTLWLQFDLRVGQLKGNLLSSWTVTMLKASHLSPGKLMSL